MTQAQAIIREDHSRGGNGTVWFREDRELVDRVVGIKRRQAKQPVEGEGYRLCEQQQLREGLKAVRASGRVG